MKSSWCTAEERSAAVGVSLFHIPASVTIQFNCIFINFMYFWEWRIFLCFRNSFRALWCSKWSRCMLSAYSFLTIELTPSNWMKKWVSLQLAAACCLWLSVKTNECTSLRVSAKLRKSGLRRAVRGSTLLAHHRVRHKVISDPGCIQIIIRESVFICKASSITPSKQAGTTGAGDVIVEVWQCEAMISDLIPE